MAGMRNSFQDEGQPRQADSQNTHSVNTTSRNTPIDQRRIFPLQNSASRRNIGMIPEGVPPVHGLFEIQTDNTPSVTSQDLQRLPRHFAGIPVSGLEGHEGGEVHRRQRNRMPDIPDWEYPSAPALPRGRPGPSLGDWIQANRQILVSDLSLPTVSGPGENDEEENPYHRPVLHAPTVDPSLHRGRSSSLNMLPELCGDRDAEIPSDIDTVGTRPTICSDDFEMVAPPNDRIFSNQPQVQEANVTPHCEESNNSGPASLIEYPLCAPAYPDEGGLPEVNAEGHALPHSSRMPPRDGSFGLGAPRAIRLDFHRDLDGPGYSDAMARSPSDSSNDVGTLSRQDASMTEGREGEQIENSFRQPDLIPSANLPMERRLESDLGRPLGRDTSATRTRDRPQFFSSEAESQESNLPPDERESLIEFPLRAREQPGVDGLEVVNDEPAMPSARFPGLDPTSPQLPRRPNRNGTSALGALRDVNVDRQVFVSALTLQGFSLPIEPGENDQQEQPCRKPVLRYNRSSSWNAQTADPPLPPVLQHERSSSLNLPTESRTNPDALGPSEIDTVRSRPTACSDDFDQVAPPSARIVSTESNHAGREPLMEFPLRAREHPVMDGLERVDADAAWPSTGLASRPLECSNDTGEWEHHRHAAMQASEDKKIPAVIPLSSVAMYDRSGDCFDRRSLKPVSNQPTQVRRDFDVGLPSGSGAVASTPTEGSRSLSREHAGQEGNLAPNRNESNNAGLDELVEFPLCAPQHPAGDELHNTNAGSARPSAFLTSMDLVWAQSSRKVTQYSSLRLGASRDFKQDFQRDDEGPRPGDAKVPGQPGYAQDVGTSDRQQRNVEEMAPPVPAATHVRPFQWIEAKKESFVSDITVDLSGEWYVLSMDDAPVNDQNLQGFRAPSPTKPTDTTQPDGRVPGRSSRTRGVPDNDSQDSLRHDAHHARTKAKSSQGEIEWNPRDAGRDTRVTQSMSIGNVNGVSQEPDSPRNIQADRTETTSAQREIAWNPRDAGRDTGSTLSMPIGSVNRVSQEPASPRNIQADRASHPSEDAHVGETQRHVSFEPEPASVTMVLDIVPTAGRARTAELLRQHSPSTVIMILVSEVNVPPAFSLDAS